jgi:TolB-like protein
MPAGHISFGPFVLDRGTQTLLSSGKPIALGHRAYSLLEALAAANGPVEKATLIGAAWSGTIVEDGNLTVQIAALRKALGVRPDGQDWIVTVPRVGYRLLRTDPAGAEAGEQLPQLAVLPFQNLSGDMEQTYFADGVVEDLITSLGRFRNFTVVARNSSSVYRGKSTDVREIGEQLRAQYILEGSVRRADRRIRVTVQLVDAKGGAHLWVKSYDGDAENIFEMQDAITSSVAALVKPRIEQAEFARSHRERPGSTAVYDLYLRALEKLYTQREADNAAAIELLERVVAVEPGHGPALAAAANAYEHRFSMAWPPYGENDRERCLELARAALEAAKDDAQVLAWSGLALQGIGRELDVGLEIVKRAGVLNPNDVRVVFCAGVGHLWGGTLEDASVLFKRVLALSPADPLGARAGLAHIALIRGQYDEALEGAMAAVVDDPNHGFLHWIMIAAYTYLGRTEEAQRALRSYLAKDPGMTLSRIRVSYGGVHRDSSRSEVLLEGLRLAGMQQG